MQVKGLDNGYLYTKDNERRIFRSLYTREMVSAGSSAFISIDGIDYAVGTGDRSISYDKTDQEINKVCTLTNLAMTGEDEYNLVVGLPIQQYRDQKEKFRKMILGYNGAYIVYHGKEMRIKINDATVVPQGVGALLSLNQLDGDCIIFDFGGMTIDIAYIEFVYGNPIIHKSVTWISGIQKMYADLIAKVNSECNFTYESAYAEKILINDLVVDGEVKSKEFLLPTLKAYLDPLMKEFELNFPARTSKIYLCGGSGIIFYSLFHKRFPNSELIKDSQFANAIGNYRLGCKKYGVPDATRQIQTVCNRR